MLGCGINSALCSLFRNKISENPNTTFPIEFKANHADGIKAMKRVLPELQHRSLLCSHETICFELLTFLLHNFYLLRNMKVHCCVLLEEQRTHIVGIKPSPSKVFSFNHLDLYL